MAVHTDALGTVENPITSAATTAVANVNDETTGDVTITGTPREDEVLTANTDAIDDEDGIGTYTYQWQADGVDIAGATNATYTLTQAEVGKVITVVAVHTDALGTVENPITSAATTAVANVNDETTGDVTITGTPREDEVLTANTDAIDDEDGIGTYTYQWQADGVDIAGATNATYTLTQAEVGKVITVVAVHTDALGTVENPITSAATTAVANVNDETTGDVTITGTPREDEVLTANTDAIDDEDGKGTFTYQWQADGVDIAGATNATYTLTQAEVGKVITVVAVHTDALGTEEDPITSTATTAVANVNDETTGEVTITGTLADGEELTANTSALADEDGIGTYTYQWQADGVDIAGATNATYTLTQAEVGKVITVVAVHTDALGTVENPITSAATTAVANVNDETTGDVTITGTPREDEVLTANTSALADNDGIGTYTYQWQADGVDIAGATNATYTPTLAEVGKVITVVAVHTDALGTVENPITSAATTAVANVNDETTGDVTITGTPREDEVLTANTDAIDDEDGIGTYTYQWQADGVDIAGATNATYTLTQAEVGKVITVVAVHTDALGTVENPITSAATTAVANVNDETTGDVTITGTPRRMKY